MASRNRIIYASQSVWANGDVLYRVQSLGTTTTFTSEDIFELGHLDIIDVVDDVPAVAVTLNTNDFGDVRTLAILAQLPPAKATMTATASGTNANLISGSTYLHGVAMADFAVTCGNLTGITVWAPVQAECDLGTLANNIDQTLFLDEVYVNSLEFSYTTGANATENYGAETDNKMWLLNDGAYVNYLEATASGTDIANGYLDLVAMGYNTSSTIPTLSTGNDAFLRKDEYGAPAVTWYDSDVNEMRNIEVTTGTAADTDSFVFDTTNNRIWFPSAAIEGKTVAADDRIQVIFAADMYSTPMNTYFTENTDSDVGALRQGQVEIFIIDGSTETAIWRLTGVTISADLTREPLTELGHLGPYDRPVTLPIPLTITVDSTAGDLETWALMAGQKTGYDAGTLDDIDLNDLMNKDDLMLMVKVYEQTDEEAGGTGANRKVNTESLVGDSMMVDGVLNGAGTGPGGVYALTDREYALKTVLVKNLKITDEGMTLDVGANATQTFGFRANNDLFVVKGDMSASLASALARNVS
jgi:hypothetical protein